MKKRHTDEEVVRWANEYLTNYPSFNKMEDSLNVPHSTVWWCFTHRLPALDSNAYQTILGVMTNNKRKGRPSLVSHNI